MTSGHIAKRLLTVVRIDPNSPEGAHQVHLEVNARRTDSPESLTVDSGLEQLLLTGQIAIDEFKDRCAEIQTINAQPPLIILLRRLFRR